MRRRYSMPLIALCGLSLGFVAAMAADIHYGPTCAPEHPVPGKAYPNTVKCLTDAEFAADIARIEAREKAEHKARVARDGPILAWFEEDD